MREEKRVSVRDVVKGKRAQSDAEPRDRECGELLESGKGIKMDSYL